MKNSINQIDLSGTLLHQFSRLIKIRELSILVGWALVYLFLLSLIDHQKYYLILIPLIILFTVLKVAYLLIYTFKRVERIIKSCHTFYELLYSISLIVFLIVVSFALDFTCLSHSEPGAFKGIEDQVGILRKLFEFMYFSVVTFATIGYGDITPVSLSAKSLVVLEIMTSFVMIVFIVSNIEKIKTLSLHNSYLDGDNKNFKKDSENKGEINE